MSMRVEGSTNMSSGNDPIKALVAEYKREEAKSPFSKTSRMMEIENELKNKGYNVDGTPYLPTEQGEFDQMQKAKAKSFTTMANSIFGQLNQ